MTISELKGSEPEPKVRYEGGVMFVELVPGEINVSQEELEVLNMHPTFQCNETQKDEEFEKKIGIMGCKL